MKWKFWPPTVKVILRPGKCRSVGSFFFFYKNKPAVALGHDHFANFCKPQGQYSHMQRCCIPLIDLMRKFSIIQKQMKQC